ncbi:MAG: molybdate ABC transporter substrate-binding protein [Acidobacteriota bacterium]
MLRARVAAGARGRIMRALVLAATLSAAAPAASQDLRVAAAADLQAVLPAIAARFEQETGRRAVATFGSSGNFFAQLQNGAPFDVFLSADIDYPRRLEADGLTAPGTLRVYASGKLVVWARTGGVDVSRGLAALAGPAVRQIAIANPAHAPYGRAAVAALRHEGLYERVQAKLVLGENISQAAQFAQSGNVDAGIIALSLALAPAMKDTGSYIDIPDSFYPAIVQAAVVMQSTRQRDLATLFVDFLSRPAIVQLLQSSGFARPPVSATAK